MRRAIYHGFLLGVREPFFADIVDKVIQTMAPTYPELADHAKIIRQVTDQEERRFGETLERGLKIFDDESGKLEGKVFGGATAFKLYDTFGFPIDLTRVIAESRGLSVDEPGFEAEMAHQRQQSSFAGSGEVAVGAAYHKIAGDVGDTKFLGYDSTSATGTILALLENGADTNALKVGDAPETGGAQQAIVTDATPFYGESGGQVGDQGEIRCGTNVFVVTDTKSPWAACSSTWAR